MKNFSGKVDIGGYGLYVNVVDNRHDRTKEDLTILFESGYGDGSDAWTELQSAMSESYPTIAYDRAGVENSDRSPNRRTALNQVKELHELLDKIGAAGPYLIVAHSIGCLNSRIFAAEYPGEVKGIVFVDSTHEDVFEKLLPAMTPERREAYINRPVCEGDFAERQESCDQVRKARESGDALRNIPIAVLTASEHGLGDPWLELQRDLVSLSGYSIHIMVENCGHYIQEDRPDIVKAAISEIIDKINQLTNQLQ